MPNQHNPMDSAALAAGAIAAVVSVNGPDGPYDIIAGVTSIVLVSVLFAYELPVPRNEFQNFAFAAVLALSSIPIAGYVLEVLQSYHDNGVFCIQTLFDGRINPDPDSDHKFGSKVCRQYTLLAWVLCTAAYWYFVRQGSRKASIAKANKTKPPAQKQK